MKCNIGDIAIYRGVFGNLSNKLSAVNYFRKTLHLRCLTVLNTPLNLVTWPSPDLISECYGEELHKKNFQLSLNFLLFIWKWRHFTDCCKPDAFGKEIFKGVYLFPTTLSNTSYNISCKYNYLHSVTSIHRTCVTDMDIGPYWGPVNLDQCYAKFNTTNDLLKLNQVWNPTRPFSHTKL